MTTVAKSLLCTTWTNLPVHQLAMSAQATPPPCGSLNNLTDPWALDTIRFHDPPNVTSDALAASYFDINVRFDGGCYEVAWPWKEFPPPLPDNYGVVFGRMSTLARGLRQGPDLLSHHDSVILK